MGTRSTTTVYDYDGQPIITMYRQYDGYPSGHGEELAEFLSSKRMVNGISGNRKNVFNGPGCLAAQMIAHFKKEAGGIYIYPLATGKEEEFFYEVFCDGDISSPGPVRMRATGYVSSWTGLPENFDITFDEEDDDEDERETVDFR